jgi:hypothetical protein
VNEYQWGNFRGNPHRLVERYYDAHLYVTNWGTHQVMFRLPRNLLDPEVVEDYDVAASRPPLCHCRPAYRGSASRSRSLA